MQAETIKFLGLTNPVLRECIDSLINTTIALKNSINVIFGNLANWQASVKPTLPPAPKYMSEEIVYEADDIENDKYFKNAASVIAEMKEEAFKAHQAKQLEEAQKAVKSAAQRDYDPTVLLEKKTFKLNENV